MDRQANYGIANQRSNENYKRFQKQGGQIVWCGFKIRWKLSGSVWFRKERKKAVHLKLKLQLF